MTFSTPFDAPSPKFLKYPFTFVVAFLLQLIIRVRRLEEESIHREKMMRAAMEDLGRQLVAKQDKTSQTVVEAVGSLKSRMYR